MNHEIIKQNEYRCAQCEQVFEKTITDEEAYSQAKEEFGKSPDEILMELICDDCFRGMFN